MKYYLTWEKMWKIKRHSDRLLKHKIENGQSGLSLDEVFESEIHIFLEKYPKFEPLFLVNE